MSYISLHFLQLEMDEDTIFSRLLSHIANNGYSQRRFIGYCEYMRYRPHQDCIDLWNSFVRVAGHLMNQGKSPAESIQWLLDTAFPIGEMYSQDSKPTMLFSQETIRNAALTRMKQNQRDREVLLDEIYALEKSLYEQIS